VWDDRERVLYWVNIHASEVWRWDPQGSGPPRVMRLPERVCAVGLRDNGGLVLALESGFALLAPKSLLLERLASVEVDLPTTRLNDGRTDPAGRFICGGMDEASFPRPISALYALGSTHTCQKLFAGITCTNSLCWSPDGETLYFTDMPTRRIDAFDYDIETGQLSNRRPFATVGDGRGLADGSVVDAEGYLWNAQWRGSKLVRYRPDGVVAREIPLPVSNPTCLAFGGPNLDTLFITSAWFSLTAEERANEPLAGSLFGFKPGVCGLPEYRYAG
jgi:L-arabinonolactonase